MVPKIYKDLYALGEPKCLNEMVVGDQDHPFQNESYILIYKVFKLRGKQPQLGLYYDYARMTS